MPSIRIFRVMLAILRRCAVGCLCGFGSLTFTVAAATQSAATAHAPAPVADPVALALAAQPPRPLILSFRNPACHLCYAMDEQVLQGAEWQQLHGQAQWLELDTDTPAGARVRQHWQVQSLPTYIVLDAQGHELGRLSGAYLRDGFYHTVHTVLTRTVPIETLSKQIRDASPASIAATRTVLSEAELNDHAAHALHWWASLPEHLRHKLAKDDVINLWLQRLRLDVAVDAHAAEQCAALAPPVFGGDLDCDRPEIVADVADCVEGLPRERRLKLLSTQKQAVSHLLYTRVLVSNPSCPDVRGTVQALAAIDRALQYPAAEAEVYRRAIDDAERRAGDDLRRSRAAADDLRAFLEYTAHAAKLDAFFHRLLAAFGDDYVYAYRYAHSLAQRSEYYKALPYYERAATLAYGANRYLVAQEQAEALLKLHRAAEAKTVVDTAIAADGDAFPELAAHLRALLNAS